MKTIKLDDIFYSIDDGKDKLVEDAIKVGEEVINIYKDVSDILFDKFGIIL